jgi:hypothetical protein
MIVAQMLKLREPKMSKDFDPISSSEWPIFTRIVVSGNCDFFSEREWSWVSRINFLKMNHNVNISD